MEEHECSCSGSEFVMVKQGAELISPSLLANIPRHSKECHERFQCLDMGEWTESSDKVLQRVRHLNNANGVYGP